MATIERARWRAAAMVLGGLVLAAAGGAPGTSQGTIAATIERVRLVTGMAITPRGRQTGVGSFPVNAVLSPDGRFVVVTNTGYRQFVSVLSAADSSLVSQVAANGQRKDGSNKKEGLYYGLAFGPNSGDRTPLYVSRGAEDRVSILMLGADGRLDDTGRSLDDPVAKFETPHHVAGLAASADGARIYAVNNNTSAPSGAATGQKGSVSVLDVAANRIEAEIPLPGFPLAVAAVTRGSHAGRKLYVSSERDGVVAVADPLAARFVQNIETGDHPTALLLNQAQTRLFVANSGSDTVCVVDTGADRVAGTLLLRLSDARGLPGATPTGLALSPDEKRLYVTLGDMNAVAVVELPELKLAGYIPVGWYPTAAVVSPDGKRLFVANAKGVSLRNPNGAAAGPHGAWGQYIQNIIEGTVSTIDLPGAKELEWLTQRVVANNRPDPSRPSPSARAFKNPGIEHVFYVIKENRTYDQILGDLLHGSGDPKLCLFPREVTPNQHALAERFVLLDNFYCAAEASADGWNWSTSGMAGEYVSRNVPYSYSGRGRSYDYEGQNNNAPVELLGYPDVARAPGGYIWDLAAASGLTYRNYGFFNIFAASAEKGADGKPLWAANSAPKKALVGHTDEDFLRFDMAYADSDAWVLHDCPAPRQTKAYGRFQARSRIAEWKREFDEFVRRGNLPRFVMIRLPRDHSQGTSPGFSAPQAMVADNDYAVGQLVDAVSRSPYWKKSAIFVIEDDAQTGFDHVDAHRSTCYVISPYVRQATIDHRFYNTDSVLRSMELLLRLPPMCQYDAIAPPLPVFGGKPENAAPYRAILPGRRFIAAVNRASAYRAADSARLNFREPDSVPDAELNDILWHAIRGRGVPKPAVRLGLRLYADLGLRDSD